MERNDISEVLGENISKNKTFVSERSSKRLRPKKEGEHPSREISLGCHLEHIEC